MSGRSTGTPGLVRPRGMSTHARRLWDHIVAQDAAGKLLKPIDAAGLEIVCETYARWREAVALRRKDSLLSENSQGTVAGPWVGIEERAAAAFKAWSAEYGLTPLSRGDLKNLEQPSTGATGTTLDDLKARREERRQSAAK